MLILMCHLLLSFPAGAAPDGPPETPPGEALPAGAAAMDDADRAPPTEPAAPPAPGEAASLEVLLRTALDRMQRGDHAGARLLLDEAEDRHPEGWVEITWQRANLAALERDYARARSLYAAIPEVAPGSHREADARFRVAELTGVMGEPGLALDRLGGLRPWRRLSPEDEAKVRYNQAIFTLELGRHRRGARRFRRALRRAPPGSVPFYEAKAWVALARSRVALADEVRFEGGQRRLQRRLAERRELILAAEDAVEQAIALREPEWVLEGLLVLAGGYEAYGDALLDAEEPDDLTPEQRALYREMLRDQVRPVWVRAETYLEEGVALARRLAWESRRVAELEAALASMIEKAEGL
jgi:tetratricopeptide (TPR) repeat protein